MSAQDHAMLPWVLPHQMARAKVIKTHLRRVGIAVALMLAAVVVTSFLPSGVHAGTPSAAHFATQVQTHGVVEPARLAIPALPSARWAPPHVR